MAKELIYLDDARRAILKVNPSMTFCLDGLKRVDAEEVVRCKDCEHFVQNEPYDPCECMKWTVRWGVAYTNPNDFCSYGERREGE